MGRFDEQIGVRRDEVGAQNADLQAQFDASKDELAIITATTVDVPVVDNTFTPLYSRGKKKNKIRVTLRYANFGTGIDIKVVLVPRALILTSTDYDLQRITTRLADAPFTEDVIATQLVTSALVKELDANTQYDIIRLVSIGNDDEDRATNPADDPVFASYPGNVLYTFTTPSAFGAPSAPDSSLIVFNRLDEHTPDEGDAEVGLKVYAPLTDSSTVQSFAAAAGTGNAVRVKCWLTRGITGDINPEQLPFEKLLSESELTQVEASGPQTGRGYVIIVCNNLKAGAPYIWTDNVVSFEGDKATASATVSFNAANFSNDLSGLTGVSLTFDNTPPYDDLLVSVDLNLTQPAIVRAMRNFTLRRKLSTDGAFPAVNVIDRSDKVNSDAYHVASTSFVIRLAEIKVKPSKTYNIQVVLRGRGNATPLTINGTFSTSASGSVVNDTAAPVIDGTLGVPIFEFDRGKFFCKLKLAAITNWNNPVKVEVCITDEISKSLNIDDLSSTTAAAVNTFYDIGKTSTKINVPIPREQIHQIFGTTGTIICKFQLTNGFTATPTLSPDSVAIDLATMKDVTTLYNPANLLRNGHFTYHDGTVAKRWKDYDPRTGVVGNVDQTGRMRFDVDEHRARWRGTADEDNQRFLIQNLGKVFMKDEFYSLVWNFYSNGTLNINEIVISVWTIKTLTNAITTVNGQFTVSGTGFDADLVKVGTVIGNGTEWRTVTQVNSSVLLTCDRAWGAGAGAATSGFAMIPQADRLSQTNVALTTADLIQKGTIQTDSDLDTTLDIYFGVVFREVIGTVTVPFMDAICLNAGQESAGYQRSIDSFETNDAGTSEDFDSEPTGGSSSGNQQLPGTGLDPGDIYNIPYL